MPGHGDQSASIVKAEDARLVVLISMTNEREAGVVRSALEMLGFTVYQQSEGPLLGYWAAAADNWQSITISSADVEAAVTDLRQLREDAAEIEWVTIDLGEPEDELTAEIAAGNRMGGCPDRSLGGKAIVLFVVGRWLLISIFPLLALPTYIGVINNYWAGIVLLVVLVLLASMIPRAWWLMRRSRRLGNREQNITT